MKLLDAPADVAQLHPRIDGWTRQIPWRRSLWRRDHYEVTYCLKQCFAGVSSKKVAVLKPVRVYVHRDVIKNAAAAWEIARQITSGRRPTRERQSASDSARETSASDLAGA